MGLLPASSGYAWARNAIFASGAIALAVYLTFPVAPPRLLPGAGFVDTLRGVFALQYDDSSLVNQFAAVPSMHLGFAVIMGMTMYRMVGGRKGAGLAVALPLVMLVSIVATGNHWFLDAALGALVALIGCGSRGGSNGAGPGRRCCRGGGGEAKRARTRWPVPADSRRLAATRPGPGCGREAPAGGGGRRWETVCRDDPGKRSGG